MTVAAVSPFGCVSTMVLLRALPKCESGRGTSEPVRDDSVCKVCFLSRGKQRGWSPARTLCYVDSMAAECLFCDNLAGSKEHLWAAWIHKRRDFGPLRVTIGNSPQEIRSDPEQKIDTVCADCNNGWMSTLENRNKSVIACALEDLYIPLDRQQQTLLSNWAIKTAIVLDSIKNTEVNPRFYQKSDCVVFHRQRVLPPHVRIWIGRCSLSALGAFGTDVAIILPNGPRIGIGTATTIIVGHLAVQVFAMRFNPERSGDNTDVQPKPGDWNKMLVQLWPLAKDSVTWPPEVTFTNGGPRSIAFLMDRWRIGRAVPHTPRG